MKVKYFIRFILLSLALISCNFSRLLGSGGTPLATPAENPQPGVATVGDPLYPKLGNGGYDVQHYDIEMDVDVASNFVQATCTIQILSTQALSSFDLDFHGMDISAVTVDSVPAKFTRNSDKLIITPANSIPNQTNFMVNVTYSGNPGGVYDPSFASEPVGWTAIPNGIFVASEVDGAQGWYPDNDTPLDKATYTFKITVPKPYVVASNGLLTSDTDNGTTETYVWEETNPMASYLATLEIGDYQLETQTGPDGLLIRNYFPKDYLTQGESVTSNTGEMIQYFSSLFGPYPFEDYGVVVVPMSLGFAMEDQTLTIMGSDMLDENVVSHELVHQWFGDSVSLESWQDIWLNEGFATYGEALWVEHQSGRAAGDQYMLDYYDYAKSLGAPGKPTVDKLFSESVYLRGGLVLYALRLTVGEDAFFKILRDYYTTYTGKNANTQDFITIAEKDSGQDLKSFFEGWLYSDKIPALPTH